MSIATTTAKEVEVGPFQRIAEWFNIKSKNSLLGSGHFLKSLNNAYSLRCDSVSEEISSIKAGIEGMGRLHNQIRKHLQRQLQYIIKEKTMILNWMSSDFGTNI